MDSKEIKPVNLKGNQPWIFTGRTDAEAPVFWPPDANSQLVGKDPDAGKDRGLEEKGTTEDKTVGWHHWVKDMSLSKLWETVKDREAWRAAVHRVAKSWTRLSDLNNNVAGEDGGWSSVPSWWKVSPSSLIHCSERREGLSRFL